MNLPPMARLGRPGVGGAPSPDVHLARRRVAAVAGPAAALPLPPKVIDVYLDVKRPLVIAGPVPLFRVH